MRDWHIMTNSGRRVNLFSLGIEDILIEDIAHSLAHINRFNGHVSIPISVAQHSVFVSLLCDDCSNDVKLQALLHDASEAYLGDITKWLKESHLFSGFRSLEHEVQSLIYRKYELPTTQYPKVSEADKLMVRWEAEAGFGRKWKPFGTYPAITSDERARIMGCKIWEPIGPLQAKNEFLALFHRLTDKR